MEEIVKKISEPKLRERNVKVKQPILPVLFSIYLIILAFLALGFAAIAIYSDSSSITSDSEVMEGIIFIVFCAISLLASAVLIFMHQYVPAGMLAIVSGIIISFAFWYVGIPTGIIGVLILRSREKLEDALFAFLNNSDPIHIKELAEKLKRTEADIEIAIHALNDSGKSINFNMESRVVSS